MWRRGGGRLGQGGSAVKRGGRAGTLLQTMVYSKQDIEHSAENMQPAINVMFILSPERCMYTDICLSWAISPI